MKALLISESDEILNSYAAFFKEAGYDTLCYRWLLKAMDNLEEIEPQLVFIDGFGYPRHWKTLAQYIKTSFKNAPLMLLAADLSEEEAKKADCLDVHCIRGSIDDAQTRCDIVLLLHPEQEQAFVPSEAPATAEEFEEPEQEQAAVFSQTPVAADRLPEQSAELIAATEQTEIGEPVESEELAKTADFSEPAEIAEPETFAPEPVEAFEEPEVPAADPIQTAEPAELAEPSEKESANAEPTTAPSLNDGAPVSARAEELAECEVEPVQPVVEPAEQSAELIAATEQTETAEPVETADFPEPAVSSERSAAPESFAPDPVERFEETEQVDNEPFFTAPVQTSLSGGTSVSAAPNEEPEADALDERNGENEPKTAAGDSEVFSFTFFHPRTKTAIYGSTVSFKPPLLYFKPDDSSVLRTLRFGQKSSGVINDKGLASDVSVQIQGFENDSIELCLLK